MLAEDDYGAILTKKLHKDTHGAKEIQLGLSQQLFNCDDVKVDFDKDNKVGDGICGMKMLKIKTGEKLEISAETQGDQQKQLKNRS